MTQNIEQYDVNISNKDLIPCEDICSLKVDYKSNYVTIQNSMINEMSFSGLHFSNLQSGSRVTFGYDTSQNYSASVECLLLFPSIHIYNKEPAEAEFLILNKGPTGKTVIISIPVISNNNSNSHLTKVLEGDVLSTIGSRYGEVTTSNTELNLNILIPKYKPYLYAEGNLRKLNYNSCYFIMFGLENAITLDTNILNKCKTIINPVSLMIDYSGITPKKQEIGINKEGITDFDDSDLFDCQIKGEYEEDDEEDTNQDVFNKDLNKLNDNYKSLKTWLMGISVFLGFVVFFYILIKLIPKLPDLFDRNS